MPLILNETEIQERISHCQDTSLIFIQSRKPPIKRQQVKKSLKTRLSRQIGKKCPTCDRIIAKSSTSTKNYNPSASSFTIEHLFPFSLGGNNTYENLMVAMCYHCNARRNAVMISFIGHIIGPKTQRTIPESGEIPNKAMDQVKRFVEWSISSVLQPQKDQDLEIQEIWRSLENFSSLEEKPDEMSILLNRISKLEERVKELEDTRWRRIYRFIKSIFINNPKKKISSSLKSIEKPQIVENSSSEELSEKPMIKFTPEEFSKGLLSQRKGSQTVTFTTMYERLINDDPKFNLKQYGIKPNHYLTTKCSDFLLITEKPDGSDPPLIHYWINGKPDKFALDYWILENWQDESSYPLLKAAILTHEENNREKRSLKDILKEDFDIPKSWTIAKKSSYWEEFKRSAESKEPVLNRRD